MLKGSQEAEPETLGRTSFLPVFHIDLKIHILYTSYTRKFEFIGIPQGKKYFLLTDLWTVHVEPSP